MDAGRLDQKITLQRPVKGQLPSGQLAAVSRREENWEDAVTCWANVKCVRVGITGGDGVTNHESRYRFNIRWRGDITAEMRVKWKGRNFELTGPPQDWEGRKVGMTLMTRELVKYGTAQSPQRK